VHYSIHANVMVQNGQEVRHHEVDRTLTDRDKATCQQAIGIGHCIGQYRPDKRSPLDRFPFIVDVKRPLLTHKTRDPCLYILVG